MKCLCYTVNDEETAQNLLALGIDGIIKEDHLGLDNIYIQAKRWAATVGRPEIQKFAGALQGQRARKGIFITTSDFTTTSAAPLTASVVTASIVTASVAAATLARAAPVAASQASSRLARGSARGQRRRQRRRERRGQR
jgi:restriction endonuclease Mrr